MMEMDEGEEERRGGTILCCGEVCSMFPFFLEAAVIEDASSFSTRRVERPRQQSDLFYPGTK